MVCRMMYVPQRTIATALFCLFAAKRHIRIEPDDIVLHAACIGIACKICDTHRPTEKILECSACQYAVDTSNGLGEMYLCCINKTEVDVCVAIGFDFEIPDFYGKLKEVCRGRGLQLHYSRRCWAMLNDVLATPLCAFFTVTKVVLAVLMLEYAATAAPLEAGEVEPSGGLAASFMGFMELSPEQVSAETLEFICSEICSFYEGHLSTEC